MTEKKMISVEKFIAQLIEYMDIPYFKNNPEYIEMWRTYYDRYKSINVLLLMYNAEISTYYHWIYIELSRKFVELNETKFARCLLEHALKRDVYDRKVIVDELRLMTKEKTEDQKIPFETKEMELLRYLKRDVIRTMGRIFNLKEKSIIKMSQREEIENKENEKETKIKKPRHFVETSYKHCISAEFAVEGALKFEEFNLIVNEVIENGIMKCIKISEGETATNVYVEREFITETRNITFKNILFRFTWDDLVYVVLEDDNLCEFISVINVDTFKESLYKFYYIEQILKYIKELHSNGLYLTNLADFYVDNNFKLQLRSFKCLSCNKVKYHELFKRFFDISLEGIETKLNDIFKEESFIAELKQHKKDLLK